MSSSLIASTTACASNAKSSYVVDCENAGRSSPVYFLLCKYPVSTQLSGKTKNENENALIALPSKVADTHRSYNGLPVSIKSVWREELHEGAPQRSFHVHCIREVVTRHTQHNLSNKNTTINLVNLFRKEGGWVATAREGNILDSPSTERSHACVPSNSRFRLGR